MGINVADDKVVEFDDGHEELVDTSIAKNPTRSRPGGFEVRHVFKRKRSRDRDGDGNPLIYSLKGIKGYRISDDSKALVMERAQEVVSSFSSELDVDFVLPLPSSKPFCEEFAEIVAHEIGAPLRAPDFVRKRTVEEMIAEYDTYDRSGMGAFEKRQFNSQLAAWKKMSSGQHVSMKEIQQKVRRHFKPLACTSSPTDLTGRAVVLVDDLYSSGASIATMRALLDSHEVNIHSAVCFLSGL